MSYLAGDYRETRVSSEPHQKYLALASRKNEFKPRLEEASISSDDPVP